MSPTKTEIDILDALLFLNDIVGDLHETGKTSEVRLELLQTAINRLRFELANSVPGGSSRAVQNGEGVNK